MGITKDFKLEELSKYFHLPEKAVAKELGICLTSLKKLCRSYGITRWPFRKLKSIQRTLAKVADEQGTPGAATTGGGAAAGGSASSFLGDANSTPSASLLAAGMAIATAPRGISSAAAAAAATAAANAAAPAVPTVVATVATAPSASGAPPATTPAPTVVGTVVVATPGAAAPTFVAANAASVGSSAPTTVGGGTVGGAAAATTPGQKVPTAKRRKAFQIGGRSVLMTDEEKSIYELTLGKPGADVTPVSVAPKPQTKANAAAGGSAVKAERRTSPLITEGADGVPEDMEHRPSKAVAEVEEVLDDRVWR
ncbi:RWP-RK domain-containing protein [Baffinella frigidus]|nr:RWP-RK domain-containing protein [Cryptophyta sp. CCMP2293]